MWTLRCLLSLLLLVIGAEGGCYGQKDCKSCMEYDGFLPCYWCPLSDKCHTMGSFYNDCGGSASVREMSQCPVPHEDNSTVRDYNQTLASQLAHWAAISYAKPSDIDPQVLQKVQAQLPGQYRILKFLQKHCELMVHYSACSVFVAISDTEKNIIISCEGTQNMDQLFEQLISATMTGMENSTIGGQVLYYNYNVHHLLYPCLRQYLKRLLERNPTYRLTLTGHSLGGAQAQLAAATLVHDGIVHTSNLDVYTFGAPRFGDAKFASNFDKLVRYNWRLVQASDPVPRIPPYFVYHTHDEVWYSEPGITPQSSYVICETNEDKNCLLSQTAALCFTEQCVRVHKSYFINIGTTYSEGKLAGPNQPTTSVYDACDSVDFMEY